MPRTLQRRDFLRAAAGATGLSASAAMSRETIQALSQAALGARDFGVRADGRVDEAPGLQRALDAAAQQQRPLLLPSGTTRLDAPLDLKGRHVAVLGDPAGHSVLRAGRTLPCLLDAQDPREVIDSPLYLFGVTLDGAGITTTGLHLRYRHRTVLDTVSIDGCDTGVDEADSWLGRRINCRTRASGTGWRLRGANHSSVWIACSFTGARATQLDIGDRGEANDGNNALLFQGCDVEFGQGHGIQVAPGATATFDTCYLGEGIGGDVLRNAGVVSLRGGTLFVGHGATGSGVVPLAGSVVVSEASLNGEQSGSLDRLVGSDATEAPSRGKVMFRDVYVRLKIGGNPFFPGDVLGALPIRVFAPLLGRGWRATASGASFAETSVGDERAVRCLTAVGANALIGLAAPLQDTGAARRGGVAYCVIAYAASRSVQLRFTGGPVSRAPWRFVGTLPATQAIGTYVKLDVPIDFTRFSTIELIMQARPDDVLELHHATISDIGVQGPEQVANIARAR